VPDFAFVQEINQLSGETIQLCYHCHKCTSGCPVAVDMEYGPDRVLRLVQLGERERLYQSHDIWLCAACETCGTRCPNEINIARVMDALRQSAMAAGVPVAEPDAVKFHRLFMFVVQNFGLMHEAVLLIAYKLWTLHLMADMDSGVKLLAKGKVPLIPRRIKGQAQVAEIFAKTAAAQKPEDQS